MNGKVVIFRVSLEIKAIDVENNLMNHLERISTFRGYFLLTLALLDMEGVDSQIPLLSEKAALPAFGIYPVMYDSTIPLSETVIEESERLLAICFSA